MLSMIQSSTFKHSLMDSLNPEIRLVKKTNL